jgi:predicted DNA-binding transcriptional regulator AlpA
MRKELQPVLDQARQLPPEELPALLGDLRQVEAIAMMRLAAPTAGPASPDELVAVPEAARRLGISKSYLYHHASGKFKDLAKREGRKVLFSSKGIQQYISKRRS